jgi:serine/threonine-protein kinase
VLGGARGVSALLAPEQVDVPALIGLSKGEAAGAATEVGLAANVEAKVHDFSAPGTVIAQDPATGTVTEGDAISLTISTGPAPLAVPDLVGMTVDVATVRLKTHQLELGGVIQRFDIAPEGTVIEQDPANGRLPWGSKVALVVSKGPQSIALPDVTGMTVGEAKKTLIEAGFKVTVTDVFSDKFAEGKVVGTIPSGGAQAPEGSTIEIQRSMGREFKELVMPDVRNMSLDAARTQLLNMGLRVTVQEVNEGCASPTVADTDPLPGQKIHENDRVALFVVC